MDYNEVKAYGRATGSARSQAMTDIAQFFNTNAATTVSDALVRYLEAHPLSLRRTALLFAQMHGAMTDSVIACWWLKREVGFWRPYEAIAGHPVVGHFDDGNADTAPEPGWTPLIATPQLLRLHQRARERHLAGHRGDPPDPRRGHPAGAAVPVQPRRRLPPRTYDHLFEIEHDAFNARIWSGLHYRRAMVDGYAIGHRTAERVMAVLD